MLPRRIVILRLCPLNLAQCRQYRGFASPMASAIAEVPYAVYVHEAIKNSLDFEALKVLLKPPAWPVR